MANGWISRFPGSPPYNIFRGLLLLALLPIMAGVFHSLRDNRLVYQLLKVDSDSILLAESTPLFGIAAGWPQPTLFPKSGILTWNWRNDSWVRRSIDESWMGAVVAPAGKDLLAYVRYPCDIVCARRSDLKPIAVRSWDMNSGATIVSSSANGRYLVVEGTAAEVRGLRTILDSETLRITSACSRTPGIIDREGHIIRPTLTARGVAFECADIESGRFRFRPISAPPADTQSNASLGSGGSSRDQSISFWYSVLGTPALLHNGEWRTMSTRVPVVFDWALDTNRGEIALAGEGLIEILKATANRPNRTLVHDGEYIANIGYSDDGAYLCGVSSVGTIDIWDSESGALLATHSLADSNNRQLVFWLVGGSAWIAIWLVLTKGNNGPFTATLDVGVGSILGLFIISMAIVLEYAPWFRATGSLAATGAGILLVGLTVLICMHVVLGYGDKRGRCLAAAASLCVLWAGSVAVMRALRVDDALYLILYATGVAALVSAAMFVVWFRGGGLYHPHMPLAAGRRVQWSVGEWFILTAFLGGALIVLKNLPLPPLEPPSWRLGAVLCSTQTLLVLMAFWAALSDRKLIWRFLSLLIVLPLAALGPSLMEHDPFLPIGWYVAFQFGVAIYIFSMLHSFRLRGFRLAIS